MEIQHSLIILFIYSFKVLLALMNVENVSYRRDLKMNQTYLESTNLTGTQKSNETYMKVKTLFNDVSFSSNSENYVDLITEKQIKENNFSKNNSRSKSGTNTQNNIQYLNHNFYTPYTNEEQNVFIDKPEKFVKIVYENIIKFDDMKFNKLSYDTLYKFCDLTKGSYINICGQCVTGIADKERNNIDHCGVCNGRNLCGSCGDINSGFYDSCGQCLKPTSEHWNNCTKIDEVIPSVIDLAVSKQNCSFILKGVGLIENNLPDFHCKIASVKGDKNLKILNIIFEDEKIYMTTDLPDNEGNFLILCTSTNGVAILQEKNLTFVDSNSLHIHTLSHNVVKLGTHLQIGMTVRGVIVSADLICYLKVNDSVIALLPTAQIENTMFISIVTCPMYLPKHAAVYNVGIIYTYAAATEIRDAESRQLEVETDAPVLVNGGFTADLCRIWIEFDRNIDGETECKSLFSGDTLQLLGNGPSCSYIGNILWILLGKNSSFKSMDEIKLMPDKIRSASGANKFFKADTPLKISILKERLMKPTYRLIGANYMCVSERLNPLQFQNSFQTSGSNIAIKFDLSSEIIIRTVGSENIKYNVSIQFQSVLENIEPSKRQRNNLIVWFSFRQLQKSIQSQEIKERIIIDNSLLVPNVNYTLVVVGENQFGDIGDEVNVSFNLVKQTNLTCYQPLQLLVSGPFKVNAYTDVIIETRIIPCCNAIIPSSYNMKYIWKLKNNNITTIMPTYIGPKLLLPGGTLKPGQKYLIHSELISKENNESLAIGTFSLETQPVFIEVKISITDIVIGTGQNLDLWASTNLVSVTDDNIQFMWSCEYNFGKCYIPGPGAVEMKDAYKNAFKQRVLHLKSGSLTVGSYNFRVNVFIKNINISASSDPVNVTVNSGDHPKIKFFKHLSKPINVEEGIYIPTRISNIKYGCQLNWEAERENGFDYFDIRKLEGVQSNLIIPFNFYLKTTEFSLKIPGNIDKSKEFILKQGASYKMTLSVYCGGSSFSSASIIIYTDSFPKLAEFEVHPLEGEALTTKFLFTTERAFSPYQDHPLLYSFGFKLHNESSHYIYSSSEWLETDLHLPSVSFGGSDIRTLIKVCNVRKICVIKDGPVIRTLPPKNFSSSSFHELILEYTKLLTGQEYSKALSFLALTLQTLQVLPDKSFYNNLSNQVKVILKSEIIQISESLKEKMVSLKQAVLLLDTSTSSLKFIPKSDILLLQIVDFKKQVFTTLITNEGDKSSKIQKFNSSGGSKSMWMERINKKFTENVSTYDVIKTMMTVTEVAIMSLSNASLVAAEIKEFLYNIKYYIILLCNTDFEDSELLVGTRIARLTIVKTNAVTILNEEMLVPNAFNSGEPRKAYVKFNVSPLTDLANDSDNICFANVVYSTDYFSQIVNVKNNFADKMRWSDIYYLTIQQNDKMLKLNQDAQIRIKIPLHNKFLPRELNLQCYVWNNLTGWMSDSCSTSAVKENYIICACPTNQHISVFAFKENKTTIKEFENEPEEIEHVLSHESEFTNKPDWELIPLKSPDFIFRINEDYKSTVNIRKIEFEENIRLQICNQLKIPLEVIQNLTVSPGSIRVTLHLVSNNGVSVNDVLSKLVRALNNGELLLFGLDGTKLNVPPQLLQISEKQTDGDEDSYIGLIVMCSILVLLSTIFISVIVTALIVKRNREKIANDIIQNLEETHFPKYRHLYLEESIDGSEKSLSHYQQSRYIKGSIALSYPNSKDEHDSGIGIINNQEKKKKF